MQRLLLALVFVAACATPVAADELRANVAFGLQDVEFRPQGANGVDGEWDDTIRYELSAFTHTQWVTGFGVSLHEAEISEASDAWKLEYEAWIFRTYVGKAPVQTRSFVWEILLFSGAGLAEGDLSRNDGGKAGDDSSFMYEVGAVTNLSLNVTDAFFIGAGAGYVLSEASLDVGGGSADLEQEGFFFQGYVGYRF